MKYTDHIPIHRRNQWLIVFSVLFFTIYSDQYTKSVAKNFLENQEIISVNSGLIVFSYVENNAGFLGILKGMPEYVQFILLNICVAIILLYCLYYLFSQKNRTIIHTFSLAVLTGGGMSNLIDRIINNGKVIDFMQFGIGSAKTGILNLADIYILTGSFLLGFLLLATDS